jgi:putative Holliday junction resolvase
MSSDPEGLPPRVLGVDYGRKRVGVAISDPFGIMAQPLPTVPFTDEDGTVAALKAICDERGVARIVVGLPVNMDGTLGPMAREVQDFAQRLAAATGREVDLFDERLTSADAESRLAETGMRWRARKKRIDQVAAALILQSWLDRTR